jgi:hypothetical protein
MKRSDDDLERLLEDWLDAEARPMPQPVLESSLEAVTRTNQVGPLGRAGQKPWIRLAAPILAVAAVVLLIVTGPTILRDLGGWIGLQPGGPGPTESAGTPQTWDAAVDFGRPPDHANPAPDRYGNPDVWSYLRSTYDLHNPGIYVTLPNFQVTEAGADQWYERDLLNLFVAYPQNSPSLSVHPWSDGDPDHNHNAIVGWISPASGWFRVTASAHLEATECSEAADGVTFTVDQNAAVLRAASVSIGDGARVLEVQTLLEAGDGLYFVVAPGADAHCDTTDLTITITGPYPP